MAVAEDAGESQTWLLHGLRMRSAVPLGAVAVPEGGVDVDLTWVPDGVIARCAPPGQVLLQQHSGDELMLVLAEGEDGYVLRVPAYCEFSIDRDLRSVTAQADGSAGRPFAVIFAGGLLVAVLLQLRRELVLHASAVESAGTATAFVAPSGGGKSTMAAILCAAGAWLVSDDLLRVELGDAIICHPGGPDVRIRLSAESVLALFAERPETVLTIDERVSTALRSRTGTVRLKSLCLLRLSSDGDLTFRRMAADEATVRLDTCPRVPGWSDPSHLRRQFHAHATLATRTAVYELTVPWGHPVDPELGPMLLRALGSSDLAQLSPGSTISIVGASGFSMGGHGP
jgi:hypothetical protein